MPRDSLAFIKLSEHISRHLRSKRMSEFVAIFSPRADTTILDVGGNASYWSELPIASRLTIVNTNRIELSSPRSDRYDLVLADGRELPFYDGCFDVGFSNSVIEHLSTLNNQRQFAAAIRAASERIWVQTPARWFPLEVHLKTPFIH
jgi:methyltransferase family protein